MDDGDHFCGNEVVAYEPLSKGVAVLPAYTLGHQFKGVPHRLQTVAERDGVCQAFIGAGSVSASATPAHATRTN